MTLRRTLLATALLALPAAAGAQPLSGLYIGAGGGYNFEEQRGVRRETGVAIPGTRSARFDDGYVGVLSLGYGFGNGWRTELEGDFRENDQLRPRGLAALPGINARGRQRLYGGMVNALFDFDFSAFGIPPSIASPYIGGGIGGMTADLQRVRLATGAATAGNSVLLDEQRTAFAYQGIAGIAFPIGYVPGLAVTAEYRYLGTVRPDVRTRLLGPTGATLGTGRAELESAGNHSALVGLRYAFNPPAPPPPPVAPPMPAPAVQQVARTYLVFFDWNRADLTDRARQIIAEAARNSRDTSVTRIEVAGHADRSGTPAYNQRLSQRRAEVVAAQLVRDGVSRAQIVTEAFGESRPLVPTADGVREPQNRRVEIILR